MPRRRPDVNKAWWRFLDMDPAAAPNGEFRAIDTGRQDRLYFPLANEAGMLSWVTPRLQGAPGRGHHAYLGLPLTAEDLGNSLVHRDFWILVGDEEPFALSGLAPGGLRDHLLPAGRRAAGAGWVEAGPGWFSVLRRDPAGRFLARATLWAPADVDQAVELMRVEVLNLGRRTLQLDAYAAVPVFARSADNFRDHRHVSSLLHRYEVHRHGMTVEPTMTFDERGHKLNDLRYTVLALGPRRQPPRGIWTREEQFLGPGGHYAAPAAVWRRQDAPDPRRDVVTGGEACAAFRFPTQTLRAGGRAEFLLIAGISADARAPQRWLRTFMKPDAAERSLDVTRDVWRRRARRIHFRTPEAALNQWLAWVGLQPTFRRIFGNSFLPQFDYGRGGRGWRDLWQDCLALLLSEPRAVRPMLLHNFAGVRIDGSNATIIGADGSFLADRNNIPRTWMDHGVWPVLTTLLYVDQTGDLDLLLAKRPYFRDAQTFRCKRFDARWTAAYGQSLRTRRGAVHEGTVFEHMLVQTLTAFFNVGEHNLLRMEGADWNDGLDMAHHRGESVAFSAFYAWNLKRLAETAAVLERAGHGTVRLPRELLVLLDRAPGQKPVAYHSAAAKQKRLDVYLGKVAGDLSGAMVNVPVRVLIRDLVAKFEDLAQRIRKQEWLRPAPGVGIFNGYYDDHGRRVEGRVAGRRRITLTGQVFPIMSGIASDDQMDAAIRSIDRHLVDPRFGGVRLNTDFGAIQPALGRAFSFLYGEKENGAVFSHMAVMYAYALYLRRRPRAGRSVWRALYDKATDQGVARILPGLPEYFNAAGRGLYCFLTGSASWMVLLLLTRVFGVRGELGDLVLDPQLTLADFAGKERLTVAAPFAGRDLEVTYRNPAGLEAGAYRVQRLTINGRDTAFEQLPHGGARLSRRLLAALPGKTTARITATLG